MAFDLNKNNGADPDLSGKKSTPAKFDLSKGNIAGAGPPAEPSKSKNLIIGLAGLLIVGGAIWYYSSTRGKGTDPVAANSTLTELTPSDTALTAPSAGQAEKGSPAVVENVVAGPEQNSSGSDHPVKTKLNHKIPATFAQGSSSFNQIDRSLIKRILTYLSENPDASIQVNGYASSDGTLEINQTVSQARAYAFKKYLVSKNVAEDRIVASGKGIENPIASNDTNAGRKMNRRVEIILP